MKHSYDNYQKANRTHVRSNDWFFERGVQELVGDYFIDRGKDLCVIDTNVFRSISHLIKYLEFIKGFKSELLVLLVFPAECNELIRKSHTSFLAANSPIESWLSSIDNMNFMTSNIDYVVNVLKRECCEGVDFRKI
ncbi:hypothetical protein ACWKX9_25925 [Enterobacter asburiae]